MERSREECDKIDVDFSASGVVYKERMNQPVSRMKWRCSSLRASADTSGIGCSTTGTLHCSSRAALTRFILRRKANEKLRADGFR